MSASPWYFWTMWLILGFIGCFYIIYDNMKHRRGLPKDILLFLIVCVIGSIIGIVRELLFRSGFFVVSDRIKWIADKYDSFIAFFMYLIFTCSILLMSYQGMRIEKDPEVKGSKKREFIKLIVVMLLLPAMAVAIIMLLQSFNLF